MPLRELRLHLVVSTLENDTHLGSVLLYPELSGYESNIESLERNLIPFSREILEELPPEQVSQRLPAGTPEVHETLVKIAPPSRQQPWREPVTMRFPVVCWKHGSAGVAYVPGLDIEVVAKTTRALDRLIQEHIEFALQRRNLTTSLRDLMWHQRCQEVRVQPIGLTADVKTPKQIARDQQEESKKSVLEEVATKLPDRSHGVVYGMDDVVLQMAGPLTARKPRSLLVVGPSGVGKTAAVHALVTRCRELELDDRRFWSTSGARLVAGMVGFGAWQERCEALCREAVETSAVIHLGNLAELMMTGRSTHNQQGVADFLRPYIARGELVAIVECTPEQLRLIETDAPNLLEAFAQLKIEEPTGELAYSILRQAADREAPQRIDAETIATLDRLHRRYATYSTYPGRPLRFLRNLMQDSPHDQPITPADVQQAFAEETGLPLFLLDEDEPFDLQETQAWFAERVIGQDRAIDVVVDLLAAVKAALTRPNRPIASLLFVGPTGVGKTEMAKALAEFLYRDRSRMTRIDMSEYADAGAVDRLIGGPLGSEGVLTARVREQPFGVVLLDEFEKAHHRFFDLLLQVLGEGRLTDAGGRLADFRNSVIIMTSNLGTQSFDRGSVGFGGTSDVLSTAQEHFVREVEQFVRPEFFNRMDRIVPFLPLDQQTLRKIAQRELALLRRREGIRYRNVQVSFSDSVVAEIVRLGYEPQYGARPLKRAIEQHLLAPLSEALNQRSGDAPLRADIDLVGNRPTVRVRAQVSDEDLSSPVIAGVEEKASVQIARECTSLRRTMHRADQSWAVLELRNEIDRLSWLEEKPERWSQAAYSQDHAKRFAQLQRLRELNDRVKDLVTLANTLEDRILVALYGGDPVDCRGVDAELRAHREQLNTLLADLYVRKLDSPDAITLVIYGKESTWMLELAAAYFSWLSGRLYDVQVYEITPWKHPGTIRSIRLGDPLSNDRAKARQANGNSLQAQQIDGPQRYFERTQELEAIGIALRVQGSGVFPLLETEAGIHRCIRAQNSASCLIHASDAGISAYQPPRDVDRWRGRREESARRVYHRVQDTIEDTMTGERITWLRLNLPAVLRNLVENHFKNKVAALVKQ